MGGQMVKKKLLVIFSDLDGTIMPINTSQLNKFSKLLKNISKGSDIDVKFCPVSGRPANYVLAVMDVFNAAFKEQGLEDSIGYGSSDQGGVVLPGKNKV